MVSVSTLYIRYMEIKSDWAPPPHQGGYAIQQNQVDWVFLRSKERYVHDYNLA